MKKVKVFKKNQAVIVKQGKKRVKYSWHFYCFGTFLDKMALMKMDMRNTFESIYYVHTLTE